MRKQIIYIVIAVLVLSAGGFLIAKQQSAKAAANDLPTESAVVERGDLLVSVDASGSLTPLVEVSLAFTTGGRVDEVLVSDGQQVKKGQPLLRLDTTDLKWQAEQARLSVSIAENDFSTAIDNYWDNDERVLTAKARLEQAQTSLKQAEWRVEQATLTAPFNGIVTAIFVDASEMANNGQTVVVLSDVSNLDIAVNLDETDVARIAMDSVAAVTVDAFPGAELNGKVVEVAASASVQSGVVLYPVTIRLNAADAKTLPLRSGMTANVTIVVDKKADTLIVPFRAVETEGGQAYLTVLTDAGSARTPVKLGLITDMQVEILSGVSAGDTVAVYANPVQDNTLQMKTPFSGGK